MAQAVATVADHLSDDGVVRRLVRDGAYGAVARDLYERGADLVEFTFKVRSLYVSHVVGADSIDADVRALKEWCDDVWDRRDVWPELVEVGVIVGVWYVWLDVRTGRVYVGEIRDVEA